MKHTNPTLRFFRRNQANFNKLRQNYRIIKCFDKGHDTVRRYEKLIDARDKTQHEIDSLMKNQEEVINMLKIYSLIPQ